MTVTTIYQQGSTEPFEETIRAWVARNWDTSNTGGIKPHFVSPHGSGKDESDYTEKLTKNDIEALKVDSLILFEGTEHRFFKGAAGKSGKTFETIISITVYASDTFQMLLFFKEFNRIISDFRPNTGARIKKTDNQNDSAIAYFVQPQLSFAKPTRIDDETHILVSTATLSTRWLIVET